MADLSGSSSSSQIITYLVVILTSAFVGYKLGVRSTASIDRVYQPKPEGSSSNLLRSSSQEIFNIDDRIDEDDLSAVQAGLTDRCKLVLLVRTDLDMSAGKISTQCANATLACYKALSATNAKLLQHWEYTGQAKIALKVASEEQMLELQAIAKSLNLCAKLTHDMERLQELVPTVVGIGPAPIQLIDQVTVHLKLL